MKVPSCFTADELDTSSVCFFYVGGGLRGQLIIEEYLKSFEDCWSFLRFGVTVADLSEMYDRIKSESENISRFSEKIP